MKKLKWKTGLIDTCTPFLKRHVVKGYIHGQLGVHKVPGSKPQQWTVTHITTGMNVTIGLKIAFMKMAEVKEFATKLLETDTWYIEGASWGVYGSQERHESLREILAKVLTADGYRVDKREYDHLDKEFILHTCDCGKVAKRYILSTDRKKKWVHKCLTCEPYPKGSY